MSVHCLRHPVKVIKYGDMEYNLVAHHNNVIHMCDIPWSIQVSRVIPLLLLSVCTSGPL